ncbi:MAG: hypothetical protein KDD70_02385 [Bdellovibrionales bacterium]|nr:hypothetical protein [Bdellovibrionales bacterium]
MKFNALPAYLLRRHLALGESLIVLSSLLLLSFGILLAPATAQTPPTEDAQIRFRFRNSEAEGAPDAATPAAGKVRCRTTVKPNGGAYYTNTFTKGSNQGFVNVSAAFSPYRCRISFPSRDYAASSFTTETFQPAEINLNETYVFARNDAFRVRLIDSNGVPVTGIPARLTLTIAKNAENTLSSLGVRPALVAKGIVDDTIGGIQFDLVGNEIYRLKSLPGAGSSLPGIAGTAGGTSTESLKAKRAAFIAPTANKYFVEQTSFVIPFPEADGGSTPQTQDIVLHEADSSVEVTLFDTDGITAIDGYVRLVSRANLQDESTDNDVRLEVESAVAAGSSIILPAISGRTFQITAGPETPSDTSLPPSPVLVTPTTGENVVVNLSLKKVNYQLLVKPLPVTSEGETLDPTTFEYLACFAYNARGERQFEDTPDSEGMFPLPLRVAKRSSRERWRIGCHGIPSTSETSTEYFGEVNYLTEKDKNRDTLRVTMPPKGTSYAEQVETVAADEDSDITFPDSQSTLEVPEEALGTSGNINISIKTATGWRVDPDAVPVDAWQIEPRTSEGTLITSPSSPIEYCAPVPTEALATYGVTEESVVIASYDELEERWIPEETVLVGPEGNRFVCASLGHFSVWGTLLDVMYYLKTTVPTNAKVKVKDDKKKTKKSSCLVKWEAPDTLFEDVLSYIVRYTTRGNRTSCDDFDTTELKERTVDGATKTTVKTKKSCCAEVILVDGDIPTSRLYSKKKQK